jgi:transcriptional regulator with XRE-family HTH domain/quercetin dioxygenase-like cupin family protein
MADDKTILSARVKALRERRGWSVSETARRAGVSVSMLWKVENGQTELTYSKLVKLAAGLDVPVGELFADASPPVRKGGRRVIDRAGGGPVIDVQANLHHFLASDLARKHYFPCMVEVNATGDGSDAEAHGGEEFSMVIEGAVRFFCEGYEAVVLNVGDSVYFDASMPHRYLKAADAPARLLSVYSHPEHARLDQPSEVQPHSRAMRAFGGETGSPPSTEASNADAPTASKPRRRARG